MAITLVMLGCFAATSSATASDNNISASPRGWSGWAEVEGKATHLAPAVTSWVSGRVDLFVVGEDGAIWHKAHDDGQWYDWVSLGGYLESGPTVTSGKPGRLDVFVPSDGYAIYHKAYADGQ